MKRPRGSRGQALGRSLSAGHAAHVGIGSDSVIVRCRLNVRFARKRTCPDHLVMSQRCHYRTHAPQQIYKKSLPVLQGPATIAKLATNARAKSDADERP